MSDKGFSLIEVIVCLVVLCACSAMVYPEVQQWKENNTLRSQTLELVAELHGARKTALMKNIDVVVSYYENGYKIFIDDGNGGGIKGDRVYQPGEKLLRDRLFDNSVKISLSDSSFTSARALFSGKVGVKAGSIVLKGNSGGKYKVVMNIVGRVRVEKD